MRKKIFVALFFCIAVYLYLLIMVVSTQNAYEPEPSGCILILGHSLEDGVLPGYYLTERLKAGLMLYHSGYATSIIVSGGKGPNDSLPVARTMMQWLVNKGVPEDAILIEENASNTHENFKYAKPLADNKGIRSVVVVTNDFHMYRSMMIANKHFDKVSAQPVRVDFSRQKLTAYLKEPFSVLKYVLTNHFNASK